MKKTEHLKLPESQKIVLFKRGLPKYIKKYIRQEKPKTLRDTLIRAKEAEELGKNHNEDEDIKSLQQSMTSLLDKIDKTPKPSTSVNITSKDINKCTYCEITGHNMANYDKFQSLINQNRGQHTINQLQTTPDGKGCGYC